MNVELQITREELCALIEKCAYQLIEGIRYSGSSGVGGLLGVVVETPAQITKRAQRLLVFCHKLEQIEQAHHKEQVDKAVAAQEQNKKPAKVLKLVPLPEPS